MRYLYGILSGFCLLISSATVLAGTGAVPAFHAEYALYIKGIKVAEMERRFSRSGDGHYLYISDTRTTGLFSLIRDDRITEESRGTLNRDTLKPLHYQYSHTGSKKHRKVSIRFDWHNQEVINQVNGSAWKMDLKAGVVDKLLYQYIIMQDLESGKRHLRYEIADGGRTKTYRFEPRGEEVINTPLGKLRTLKLRRNKPNSRRETVLWCAENLHFLPVKVRNVEDDGKVTTAVVQKLQGLGVGN